MGVLAAALVVSMPLMGSTPSITNLYHFTGEPGGAFPEGNLVAATSGALYGTTEWGGTYGWGTVFALLPPAVMGQPWTQKTIYNFTGGADGANPIGNMVMASNQVLYGVTYQGGSRYFGTVFSLTPQVGGIWTPRTLYSFKGGNDGAFPAAGLTQSPTTMVLYGGTLYGGSAGFGTVFAMTPMTGGAWTEKVLYTFLGGMDGMNPQSTLTLAGNSMLYGTTAGGGASDAGTVFRLAIAGGVGTETIIYSFTGLTDGASPEGGVVAGPGGVLYGTTFYGGSATGCLLGGYATGCGVLYQLTPPASGTTWTLSVIYTFSGNGTDGAHPFGNLLVAPGQVIYGATFAGGSTLNVCFPASYSGCGSLYRFQPTSPPGAWTGGTLVTFNGDNGGGPNGVAVSKSGAIYGTTYNGGSQGGGFGTVFQLLP